MIERISELSEVSVCGGRATCRQAVVRAYQSLIECGVEDRVAFETARRVYLWHHPEVAEHLAPYVIADWLP